jgi:hypothetical protein
MKKTLSILLIVLAFSLNAQVTGITLPKLNSGSIKIDTTGKNLKSWILYRVENHTAGKIISYNELLMDSLKAGNYWLLATSNNPNYPFNYCLEAYYSIGVLPPNPCATSDNLQITSYQDDNSMLYFCGSSNAWPPVNSLQWYLDSLPINGGFYGVENFCKNAIYANDNVFTLVSYGNTCNEYKTATLAFTTSTGNLTYPYVTVFAGSGSFTNEDGNGGNNGGNNDGNNDGNGTNTGNNTGGGNNNTASLNEIETNSIKVYPNPFNDNLTIKNAIGSRVSVYDMLGNLLINENGNYINTEKLVNGNYILEITSSNGLYRQLIIKHNN